MTDGTNGVSFRNTAQQDGNMTPFFSRFILAETLHTIWQAPLAPPTPQQTPSNTATGAGRASSALPIRAPAVFRIPVTPLPPVDQLASMSLSAFPISGSSIGAGLLPAADIMPFISQPLPSQRHNMKPTTPKDSASSFASFTPASFGVSSPASHFRGAIRNEKQASISPPSSTSGDSDLFCSEAHTSSTTISEGLPGHGSNHNAGCGGTKAAVSALATLDGEIVASSSMIRRQGSSNSVNNWGSIGDYKGTIGAGIIGKGHARNISDISMVPPGSPSSTSLNNSITFGPSQQRSISGSSTASSIASASSSAFSNQMPSTPSISSNSVGTNSTVHTPMSVATSATVTPGTVPQSKPGQAKPTPKETHLGLGQPAGSGAIRGRAATPGSSSAVQPYDGGNVGVLGGGVKLGGGPAPKTPFSPASGTHSRSRSHSGTQDGSRGPPPSNQNTPSAGTPLTENENPLGEGSAKGAPGSSQAKRRRARARNWNNGAPKSSHTMHAGVVGPVMNVTTPPGGHAIPSPWAGVSGIPPPTGHSPMASPQIMPLQPAAPNTIYQQNLWGASGSPVGQQHPAPQIYTAGLPAGLGGGVAGQPGNMMHGKTSPMMMQHHHFHPHHPQQQQHMMPHPNPNGLPAPPGSHGGQKGPPTWNAHQLPPAFVPSFNQA